MIYPQLHGLYTPVIWNQIGRLFIIELEFLLLLLSNPLHTQSESIIFIIHQDSHFLFVSLIHVCYMLELCISVPSFTVRCLWVSVGVEQSCQYIILVNFSLLWWQSHSRSTHLFCISFCSCTIEKGFSWIK